MRHGAESEFSAEPFRSLNQAHESHFRSVAEVDATHQPQWMGVEVFVRLAGPRATAPLPTVTKPTTGSSSDLAKPLARRSILFSDLWPATEAAKEAQSLLSNEP